MVDIGVAVHLKRLESGDVYDGISTVLKELREKKIKHQDVFDYYAERYMPIVQDRVRSFQTGKLFICQTLDFDGFMECVGWGQDNQTWLDVQCEYWMAKKELDKNIFEFSAKRINTPNLSYRRFLRSDAPGANRAFADYRNRWASENQRNGWMWTR
jgi:hypothetical protein